MCKNALKEDTAVDTSLSSPEIIWKTARDMRAGSSRMKSMRRSLARLATEKSSSATRAAMRGNMDASVGTNTGLRLDPCLELG